MERSAGLSENPRDLFRGCRTARDCAAPAQEPPAAPTDWFAGEPKRPKAEAPIPFSRSWDDARAEAKRTGRRLVAYFTGEWCGWCRGSRSEPSPMPKSSRWPSSSCASRSTSGTTNTFAWPTSIRSIRSRERTSSRPDGRVIDRRRGYLAATDFAAWLKGVGDHAAGPRPDGQKPNAPAPVGAAQATKPTS